MGNNFFLQCNDIKIFARILIYVTGTSTYLIYDLTYYIKKNFNVYGYTSILE